MDLGALERLGAIGAAIGTAVVNEALGLELVDKGGRVDWDSPACEFDEAETTAPVEYGEDPELSAFKIARSYW